ncbi:MAG: AraC family transcriptional regulator [Moheibacter sp.]
MKLSHLSLFLFFFLLQDVIFAQNGDSLNQKSNRYLVSKLESFQFNRQDSLVWVYLNAYINNAKKKKDFETLYYGYRSAIYYSDKEQKFSYADSAIIAAKQSKSKDIEGNAYLSVGGAYYEFRDYKNSLDYYLKANNLLQNSTDKYLKNRVLYNISVIKSYLGYYEDAEKLLDEAIEYFAKKITSSHTLYYLRCLYRKGEIYQATGRFKEAADANLLGLQESLKHNEKIQEQYFHFAIGLDDYFAGNYALTIQNINKALPTLIENQYFEQEAVGYYYIAQSYLGLNQKEKALTNFQKVDSVFVQHQYLNPEVRQSYEWLINYYKKNNNKDLQLYYINQLLEVDRVSAENNKYLAFKINKEYDTKTLLETKRKLERRFTVWQRYSFWIFGVLLAISIVVLIRYLKLREKNKVLREQYEHILQEQVKVVEKPKHKSVDLPQDTVEEILNRLDAFEKSKGFLDPKIDQRYLAEKFKTNSAYLSKVINTYKENNFSGYLNHLRIRYLIQLLKNEPQYRHYTIQSLSELCGYTNPRHFSDAFLAETKLRPTYFMEQMQKEKEEPIGELILGTV